MNHRHLFPALFCLGTLTVSAIADEVPKPDGMKLIYQHDFEDTGDDSNRQDIW